MKLSFWFVFAYLAIAVVAQVMWHVSHALLIAIIDFIYLAALITNRSAMTLLQSIVILVLFAAWNDRQTMIAADIIVDTLFVVASVSDILKKLNTVVNH